MELLLLISGRGKKYIEDGVQLGKMKVRAGEVEELWEGIDGEPCKLVKGFKEIVTQSDLDFNRMILNCLLNRLKTYTQKGVGPPASK